MFILAFLFVFVTFCGGYHDLSASSSGYESYSSHESDMQLLLDKALYGQDDYAFRIRQFKKITTMVNSETSPRFLRLFLKSIHGLFMARSLSDEGQLTLLRDLLLSMMRTKQLEHFKRKIALWLDRVNDNLTSFALKDGDIVRVRSDDLHEFIYALAHKRFSAGTSSKLCLTSEGKMDVQLGASLFKIRKNTGVGRIVHYGEDITLEPLYVQVGGFIYTVPQQSPIALTSSFKRGKTINGVGIRWGLPAGAVGDASFVFKRSSDIRLQETLFTDKVPVLAGEGLVVMHTSSGRAFCSGASSAGKRSKTYLGVQKIVRYHKKTALDSQLIFSFVRVTPEELKHIHQVQFSHLLRQAKMSEDTTLKIMAYQSALQLPIKDIHKSRQEMLIHDLQKLFYARKPQIKLLKSMKELFMILVKHSAFEDNKLDFENYVGQINNDLAPLGLQYGDIICLRAGCQEKQLLWTCGESRYQSSGHMEIVAGPNSHVATKQGPQLFKVVSADGKMGGVGYGDGIKLLALYAGGSTMPNSLGSGQNLWVSTSSYVGKNFYELLVGPNSCSQAQNGQEVFFFRPGEKRAATVVSKHHPVISGDIVEIWSRQFERKVWINRSSLSAHNGHEVLVGPNDDNHHGINRTSNGQQLFYLEQVSQSEVVGIADADFIKRLKGVRLIEAFSEKMKKMQDLYRYASKNSAISTHAKQEFINDVQGLFLKRHTVDAPLLSPYSGFLITINTDFFVDEQRKLLHSWAEKLAFEKAERVIDASMAQADEQKSYLALINRYHDMVPLMRNKYAQTRAKHFIEKLYALSLHIDKMQARELKALKDLLTQALNVKYHFAQEDGLVAKLSHLIEMNKELRFKAQLAQAAQAQGASQISAYKSLLPYAPQMTDKQRIELIRSLKSIFESKINEIKEIRGVLEHANSGQGA